MNFIKNILIATVTIFSINSTLFATHIAGGNISYSCTGTPNQFLVTLTLYRDCSGVSAPFNPGINFSNSCGLPNPFLSLTLLSSSEVSQLCTPEIPNSTCGSGSLPGMQEYIYTGTVMLNPVCDAWTLSYEVCDRNPSTNLVGSSNCFYVKSTLYSATAACNNSPIITAQPIPYVCANIPVSYDFGVLEPDGNVLVFSLVNALGAGGANLAYNGGYSATSPIPGITINPATGQLNFTSAISGNFVVTVLIEEYDLLGNLVGTLMQDIQFVVQVCPNTPPNAPLSITNFNNFGTNATLTGSNTITLCNDDQFCFDVVFDDPDLADDLVLSSNIDLFLPGATFVQTGVNPATATICWTFQPGYTGSIISVVATDGVCPIPGIASFPIDLDVPPPLNAGTDSTVGLCQDDPEVNLLDLLGGNPVSGGIWIDSNGDLVNPIVLPDTLIPGIYEYIVGDTTANCYSNAFLDISVTILTANWVLDSLANVTCNGFNDGTAFVNNITGTMPPFDIEWINGVTVFETSSVVSVGSSYQDDLDAGNWTLSITNQAGCNWTQLFVITEPPALDPGIDNTVGVCETDAQINLFTFLGGSPQTGGIWLDSNGDSFNPIVLPDTLISGLYEYVVGDTSTACFASAILDISVSNLTANWVIDSLANVSCFGFGDGTAFVNNIIGSPEPIDIDWINGVTLIETFSVVSGASSYQNDLTPGNWTLSITNLDGCNWSQTFTITEPTLLDAGTGAIQAYCQEDPIVNLFSLLGGTPQTGGIWIDDNGDLFNPVVLPDNLPTGTYTYIIGDTNSNCFASASLAITVTGVDGNWVLDSLANISCDGTGDGTAFVNNIVGTGGPFDIEWINGATVIETLTVGSGGSSYQNDLVAGNWTVLITNQAGCNWSQTFTITDPQAVDIDFISNDPSCYGFTDGSFTVNPSGSSPFTFTITNSVGTQLNAGNTNAVNNLVTGWYYVNVIEGSGCIGDDSIFIDQPGQLDIDLIITQPLCYGFPTGVAFVDTVYNHAGNYNTVSFFWNPNPAGINGIGQDSSSQLGPGDYALTVNDIAGCSRVFDFNIAYPDSLYFIQLGFDPAYCRLYPYQSGNGVVYAAASGGTPDYTYLWTELNTGATSPNTTWGGRNPGDYQIVATDDNGCTLTQTITVDSLNPVADFDATSAQFTAGTYEGTAVVDVHFVNQSMYFANPNDPNADTTFFWHFGFAGQPWELSEDVFETFDTSYSVGGVYPVCLVALNKNGCSDTLCKDLIIYDPLAFTPVNVFTPDGDDINDGFSFVFYARAVSEFNCVIVNRWGHKVFEMSDIADVWDGKDRNGDLCTDGVYFYTYNGTADNGSTFAGQGTVQIINSK